MVDGEYQQAARAEQVPGEPLYDYDPAVIGPYRVLSRLGSGGMGTVYLAEEPGGRRVAVKVIRPDLAANAEFRRRFQDEMEAARRVRPFCTAEVLATDTSAHLPYMVTEFIDGVRLDHEVAANGPLSASTLTGTAIGVATALTVIHQAGLVHRDLKPSNVILSLSGPRVIDFGIAQALEGTVAYPTRWGFGSAGWMAPEQINGQPIGPPADMFVWGILVAYAGTGLHPFGGGSDVDLAHQIVSGQPDLDGLLPSIRPLVAAALAKHPGDRPTARQLLHQLVEGGPGEHFATSPDSSDNALERAGQAGAVAGAVSHTRPSQPSFTPQPRPTPPRTAYEPSPYSAAPAPPPPPPLPPHPHPHPTPPIPPGEPRRRRSRGMIFALFLLAVLTAVAVALVVMVPSGGSQDDEAGPTASPTTSPSASPSASPTVGTGPRDGELEFTVTSSRCGEKISGIVFAGADEDLCIVDVTARNVGDSARFFLNNQQFLVDREGGRHQASQLDAGQILPITPDSTAERTLVFKVPERTQPAHVELQDSENNGGTAIPITG